MRWKGVQGRGLDHGAWVPLKVAFPSSTPPPAPLLQISLPRPSSADQLERSIALGRALAPLREQGFLILASGQPVHNLRDLGKAFNSEGKLDRTKCPYGGPFLKRVGQWVRESAGDPTELDQLRCWPDYKRAVPEDNHFAPIAVALGAGSAFGGKAVVELEHDEGPIGWGFYSWNA
jgi:4,5-DOPA dioxygenase extradiol